MTKPTPEEKIESTKGWHINKKGHAEKNSNDELADRLREAYDGHYFDSVAIEARKWAIEIVRQHRQDMAGIIIVDGLLDKLRGGKL